MQEDVEGIKKAISEGKVNRQAIKEMRGILESSKLDENKVRNAVWSAIDWLIQTYLEKRYCSKEGVITSVVLGINDWLGELYKTVPAQEHSAFIRKQVSNGLDDIVVQVSKVFKKEPSIVALSIRDACKSWLDKTYAENGMQ